MKPTEKELDISQALVDRWSEEQFPDPVGDIGQALADQRAKFEARLDGIRLAMFEAKCISSTHDEFAIDGYCDDCCGERQKDVVIHAFDSARKPKS